MKRIAILFLCFMLTASAAWAKDVAVSDGWARASAGVNGVGAAFLTIHNMSSNADKLVSASTPVAKTAELHSHAEMNGVMTMRKVESIEVGAGQMVELKPGGYHVMLFSLQKPLTEGDAFPLTLVFEKAGAVTVDVHVSGVSAMGHHMDGDHHPMGEGGH